MEFTRKKRLIGIVSIVAALALVGIFGATFPRTSYYKSHQRANRLKQVLRNVAPPGGAEVEIDVIYSKTMPMALGTYVLNASCAEVQAHYKKEFPKHGFTYAGDEIGDLNPRNPWIIFLTPEYRAILHCSNVKSEVTREFYSIQLYYQNYPEPPPARTSTSASALTPDTYPAPQARKSLAQAESSNAKLEGWIRARAVQPKRDLGFSPYRKTPQGLNAKLLLSRTARLKSRPDTCLVRNKAVLFNSASHSFFSAPPRLRGGFAFFRASVSGVPDEPVVGSVGWLSLWWGLSA